MNNTTIEYADFAEYDRRQRAIEHHLLGAFFGGLAVGMLGMLLSGNGPHWAGQIYDPYAYLALSLVVGATASGFAWALLTTFLASLSTLVAAIGASALRGADPFHLTGPGAAGLNWTLALLVCLGLLAYATRRDDVWGDVAAGAVGAALIADVVARAAPGVVESEQSFWPGPAVVIGVLTVAAVLVLRRNVRGRVRALALSATLAGLVTAGMTAAMAGWFPLAG
ncbi:hypothetical protein AB0K18_42155 [Nonomuraea sp. NPDC049421]|uniref:hypothetical protein n=1 Tax=Nonomuraea sp. NPDC049421 TaxID=3155275 RepID=UPI00344644C2